MADLFFDFKEKIAKALELEKRLIEKEKQEEEKRKQEADQKEKRVLAIIEGLKGLSAVLRHVCCHYSRLDFAKLMDPDSDHLGGWGGFETALEHSLFVGIVSAGSELFAVFLREKNVIFLKKDSSLFESQSMQYAEKPNGFLYSLLWQSKPYTLRRIADTIHFELLQASARISLKLEEIEPGNSNKKNDSHDYDKLNGNPPPKLSSDESD